MSNISQDIEINRHRIIKVWMRRISFTATKTRIDGGQKSKAADNITEKQCLNVRNRHEAKIITIYEFLSSITCYVCKF